MGYKYYIVRAKCGHVGKQKHIEIDFAVYGLNAKEAATRAREIPRVLHHRKDAIVSVNEVSHSEYIKQYDLNAKNPYLNSLNIQEQRKNCPSLYEDLIYENRYENNDKKKRKERVRYIMKKYKVIEELSYL